MEECWALKNDGSWAIKFGLSRAWEIKGGSKSMPSMRPQIICKGSGDRRRKEAMRNYKWTWVDNIAGAYFAFRIDDEVKMSTRPRAS